MTRRAIFLDVDGTYAHHGTVPTAHADAVRRARAAGHAVLLCTGRPLSLIPPHLTAAGFDGIVAGAGAFAALGSTVLLDTRFPRDLAARALEVLDAGGAMFFLEAPEATHARPATIDAMRAHVARQASRADAADGSRDVVSSLMAAEDLDGVSFGKITTLYAEVPLTQIASDLGSRVDVIPSSIPDLGAGAGELFLAGVHKAVGMAAVVEALGIARERVVACGDGLNDVEMLDFAGVAVAIEGAPPEVIALADHVAAPPSREGLAGAFAELGLLG